jgi:hypothetical protein
MKVPQFERWSQELWNSYAIKQSRRTEVHDTWKAGEDDKRHRQSNHETINLHQSHVSLKNHSNSMRLLSEFTTYADTRRKLSLNAKMGSQFYVIGTYIDIKV